MTLACLTLVIPAAYHSSSGDPSSPNYSKSGLLIISRGTAILLLLVYIAYLFFQVSSPPLPFPHPLFIFWGYVELTNSYRVRLMFGVGSSKHIITSL